ncbi:hypothetical protein ACQE98_11090 [Ornithinimicrobium sp. W1679]|uniref:hypothetical protein n=1 Tax=Ornithinimicrobium sp. W1679 TaxID=3418770 RepID=UPI003CF2C7E7
MTGVPLASLPRVWLGPGTCTDAAAVARLPGADGLLVPVGPVTPGAPLRRTGATRVHGAGVGGVEHDDARGTGVATAADDLVRARTAGLRACLCVRAERPEDVAAAVEALLRHPDGDVVAAVEVDLRGRDEQVVLRIAARVREVLGRSVPLLVKVLAVDPQLVAVARSAVAGGAGGVVVAGQVPLAGGRWWTGPSTAAVTRSGLRTLRAAAADHRWPGAVLVGAGGVHSVVTARAAVADGASAVQLGTALWADPTLLPALRTALADRPPGDPGPDPDPRPPTRSTP